MRGGNIRALGLVTADLTFILLGQLLYACRMLKAPEATGCGGGGSFRILSQSGRDQMLV